MWRGVILGLLLCACLAVGTVGALGEPDGPCPPAEVPTVEDPTITAVYPNTNISQNVGEYVRLEFPEPTNLSGWTLADEHTTASLPPETHRGPVAVTRHPDATAQFTDYPTIGIDDPLRLAADGDALTLANASGSVDAVTYGRARTMDRWYRTGPNGTDGGFWPHGATCTAPVSSSATVATTFVLPDAPEVAVETLESAEERIRIGAYTLTEPAVVDELVDAAARGVDVAVLLEAGPVGGSPPGTEAAIERLEAAAVDVTAIGGGPGRYRFHHPKYAVVDDTVLVTTENWNEAGIGGARSRGWGVVLEAPVLADHLVAVFDADASGWDLADPGRLTDVDDDDPPSGEFPTTHEPHTVTVDSVDLVLAPDAAEPYLTDLLSSAEESILLTQPRIGAREFVLLEATLEAARAGASVRILLDSSWYVEDDNHAIREALTEVAAAEGLDLEVRIDEPTGYGSIHAKGIVADDVAVVGSVNWNDNSLRNNREVLVALHGREAAAYFRSVFEADWAGQRWTVPIDLVGAVLVALTAATVLAARLLVFEPE